MPNPILLLTKSDRWCATAGQLAKAVFGPQVIWHQGKLGMPLPEGLGATRYDAILSFLSAWIIPQWLIDIAPVAINFHPGSCDYPGIGCYNFALYEEAKRFGVVCHHMTAKVDTGKVVCEHTFPIFPLDSVETLKFRSMIAMLSMFHDICSLIAEGKALPVSDRQWTRPAFTRKQLNDMAKVSPDMPREEIRRRVRAMSYPGYPGAEIEVAGVKFLVPSPKHEPLA